MEERFSLAGGRGWLTVREEGLRALCQAELPDDGRGLYKVFLQGEGGRLGLGTLVPERGALRLHRTLSIDELRRKRCWPPAGAAAELAFPARRAPDEAPPRAPSGPPPGWMREGQPGRLLGERLLAGCAARSGGALLRREAGGFALAFPYGEHREFYLAPLFCFAGVEELGGGRYAVFHFNQCGCPTFPNKGIGAGETMGVNHAKEGTHHGKPDL